MKFFLDSARLDHKVSVLRMHQSRASFELDFEGVQE
jgi:hypothetical protein